jgi:uracil-DNA glycosylase family 4
MSLPIVGQDIEEVPTAPIDPTVDEAHRKAMERGANCLECPLRGLKEGPVLGEIRPGTNLACIAEAPGGEEVKKKRVLVGPTGDDVIKGLWRGGKHREDVSLFNVLACRPPGGLDLTLWLANNARAGKKSPIDCCRPRLLKDIEEANPKVFLTLGKYALTEIAHLYNIGVGADEKKEGKHDRYIGAITDQAGHPEVLPDGKVLLPTLHPSFAMHGNLQHEHVILDEIERACRIADRGGVDWVEPNYILAPTFTQIQDWVEQVIASDSSHVACDIETSSLDWHTDIRCIGLGAWIGGSESIIVVPVLYKNGEDVWTEAQLSEIRLLLRRLFRCKKGLFHNGPFDTRLLEYHGFRARDNQSVWAEVWDDTEIGHHVTFENSNPHKLSYVSKRFMEVPLWKVEVDHKNADDEENVSERTLKQLIENLGEKRFEQLKFRLSDLVLWLYNAKDILTTMRSWSWRGTGIAKWIEESGNQYAYGVDMKKAIVARDMGDLGLLVNRNTQKEYSAQLERAIKRMEHKLRVLAGKGPDYNPNSSEQVGELLFDEWGFSPVAYTDSGQPSTGIQALIELKNHGVDERTGKYIELHIVYKSHRKLKDAFVDNMPLYPTQWEELGLLHSTFNVHVVPSGRLSSSGYNVQNLPKRAVVNLRRMFVAAPGHKLISSDYDQGEARVFAVEAKDQYMYDAFMNGMDVHAINAATLLANKQSEIMPLYEKIVKWKKSDKPEEKNWAEQVRLIAKVFVFSEQYGTEEKGLFQFMSTARDKATGILMFPNLKESRVHLWHERYHKYHSTTKQWQKKCRDYVKDHGRIPTAIRQRYRAFPGGYNTPNEPPSHRIQGTLADIVDEAFLEIYEEVGFKRFSPWSGLVNQVHDELVCQVPDDKAEWCADMMDRVMNVMWGGLPITATAEIMTEWTGKDLRKGVRGGA